MFNIMHCNYFDAFLIDRQKWCAKKHACMLSWLEVRRRACVCVLCIKYAVTLSNPVACNIRSASPFHVALLTRNFF